VGLSAIRASPTRDGVHDLGLFAGTGVLDKVPDVDNAIGAGVGALVLVEVEIVISGSWVRMGCTRLLHVHRASPFLWAGAGECTNTRPAQTMLGLERDVVEHRPVYLSRSGPDCAVLDLVARAGLGSPDLRYELLAHDVVQALDLLAASWLVATLSRRWARSGL